MTMLSGVGLPGGEGGNYSRELGNKITRSCSSASPKRGRVREGLWSVVWSPFDLIFALWWSSHGRSNYCLCFQEKYYEFIVLKLTSSCLMCKEQKRRNYANNSVL